MSSIILQGIQYDAKSSYLKGPSFAPPLIRKALHCGSSNYFSEDGISIDTPRIVHKGDFEISSYFDIETITAKHLTKQDKIFTLGGDHSISFPIIKAFHQKYPVLDILQIDAHPDLYEELYGDKHSHAFCSYYGK